MPPEPASTASAPEAAPGRRGAPDAGGAAGGSRLRAIAGSWEGLLVALLLVTMVVGQGLSSEFLTADSFTTGSLDFSEVALMALALTLVIVAAEIDLSVASMLALSSALMASLWNSGLPLELIMPICIAVGALCGAFNGVLVAYLGLPSLAVTIGTLALFRGLAFVVIGDESVTDFPTTWTDRAFGNFAGTLVPNTMVLFAILAVALRRAAARHAVRAVDLRHRRERGGGALRRAARAPHQADPLRPVRDGGRAGRHRHLAAQLDGGGQRRPGLRAHRGDRGAARRRVDLRRPRHDRRRHPRAAAAGRHPEGAAAERVHLVVLDPDRHRRRCSSAPSSVPTSPAGSGRPAAGRQANNRRHPHDCPYPACRAGRARAAARRARLRRLRRDPGRPGALERRGRGRPPRRRARRIRTRRSRRG